VNSGGSEELAVAAPLVTPVVLLFNEMKTSSDMEIVLDTSQWK